ncbi:ABC transporter permease [Paramicrobacterium agarici]|uniref:Peptide/nickel transport system permease protein n=1 Tax=Paramicrobacterium agarici TaxID=630514 RepID=A0A2A9DX00_9MICO|nr:ABC transporter permease [Microbacterium agarici]PFG30896.1 peptide/nickel transport system permease protein [Microbacterium agarici]
MTAPAPVTRRPGWARSLLRSPAGLFGIASTTVLVLCALVSLVWTPHDPVHTDVLDKWQPPSPDHLLGTDNIGRDIFSVLLAGSRVTLQVAIGSALVGAIVGVVFAVLGALTSRWFREVIAVLIDILIAFPTLLIAMMLASAFGGSLMVVILAVGISFGVNIGRVTRPEIRRVSHSEFVTAGVAAGLGPVRNLTRHILPNVAPVFIVQLSWCMAVAVLAETGLSYLGYGAPVSTPSWGRVLAELQAYISIHPLSVVWPGLAITITVLGFNLLGDGLRDATDPRLGRPEVITA